LLAIGVVLSFAIPQFGLINQYYQLILIYVFINIILTTSLNLVNGYMGEFSVGHAGFMALGAYIAARLCAGDRHYCALWRRKGIAGQSLDQRSLPGWLSGIKKSLSDPEALFIPGVGDGGRTHNHLIHSLSTSVLYRICGDKLSMQSNIWG
jgi:ABC-type branched-subunit amino acid transport system permease subunit